MDKQSKKFLGIFARYIFLLLIGANNLYIIYLILTPLTLYVTTTILLIFTNPILQGNFIGLTNLTIQIVPACVAGSAFYLLLILIFSTADIKPATRTKATLTAIAILFALNILRILALIPFAKSNYFQIIHWTIWYIVSTILVIATWFTIAKIYKIKSIPIYTDIKYLLKSRKKPKRDKQNNKTSDDNSGRNRKKTPRSI